VKVRRGVKVNRRTIAALVGDTCLRSLPGRPTWNGMTVYPTAVLASIVCFSCRFRSEAVKKAAQFPLAPNNAGTSYLPTWNGSPLCDCSPAHVEQGMNPISDRLAHDDLLLTNYYSQLVTYHPYPTSFTPASR
jgi:hypothetical protein